MEERILFVDDDPNVLEAYQRRLQHVLRVYTAEGPHVGLREFQEKGPFAVVVADMNMPLMNGVEFLQKIKELDEDTVRMMLTGNADIKTAMEAVNQGAVFRFLTKPCPSKLMGNSLADGIRQYRLVKSEKELLEGTLSGTVELLTEVLSWVNPDAFGRTMQFRNTARAIAAKLRINDSWEIGLAATLSQIGIMAVPAEILQKSSDPASLSPEELFTLNNVPSITKELLERIPRLEAVAEIVFYQDKHYDGGGFPSDSLRETKIPIGARILKAAKDFHQLRAEGGSRRDCVHQMRSQTGVYDPRVLNALDSDAIENAAKQEATQITNITMKELRSGLILAAPILTVDGRKLVAEDTEITGPLLVRLSQYAQAKGVQEPICVRIRSQET